MRIGHVDQSKVVSINQNEKKKEYVCKNPYLFVLNLFFAKFVHKKQEKDKKAENLFCVY